MAEVYPVLVKVCCSSGSCGRQCADILGRKRIILLSLILANTDGTYGNVTLFRFYRSPVDAAFLSNTSIHHTEEKKLYTREKIPIQNLTP